MLLSFDSFHPSQITRHVAPWPVIEISADPPLVTTRGIDRRYLTNSANPRPQVLMPPGSCNAAGQTDLGRLVTVLPNPIDVKFVPDRQIESRDNFEDAASRSGVAAASNLVFTDSVHYYSTSLSAAPYGPNDSAHMYSQKVSEAAVEERKSESRTRHRELEARTSQSSVRPNMSCYAQTPKVPPWPFHAYAEAPATA
ncbi:hypothetical protein B0T12DRAFT_398462 [Alternaria alternata]|nr:hypothetical protein B0T12DRAFT_398462 [Alternaria alternata]